MQLMQTPDQDDRRADERFASESLVASSSGSGWEEDEDENDNGDDPDENDGR